MFLFQTARGVGGGEPAHATIGNFILIVMTLTAGTTLLMWMGELITQRGIGNGISLMIFAASSSGCRPASAPGWNGATSRSCRCDRLFGVIVAVVFVTGGPAAHPGPVREADGGAADDGGRITYLPLRVNMAGVIPVIFAAAVCCSRRRRRSSCRGLGARLRPTFFSPGGWPVI